MVLQEEGMVPAAVVYLAWDEVKSESLTNQTANTIKNEAT
jgi:hypothetical protein